MALGALRNYSRRNLASPRVRVIISETDNFILGVPASGSYVSA